MAREHWLARRAPWLPAQDRQRERHRDTLHQDRHRVHRGPCNAPARTGFGYPMPAEMPCFCTSVSFGSTLRQLVRHQCDLLHVPAFRSQTTTYPTVSACFPSVCAPGNQCPAIYSWVLVRGIGTWCPGRHSRWRHPRCRLPGATYRRPPDLAFGGHAVGPARRVERADVDAVRADARTAQALQHAQLVVDGAGSPEPGLGSAEQLADDAVPRCIQDSPQDAAVAQQRRKTAIRKLEQDRASPDTAAAAAASPTAPLPPPPPSSGELDMGSRPQAAATVPTMSSVRIALCMTDVPFRRTPPSRLLPRSPAGEGEIRTPDTGFSPYNGLANRRLRPLGHLSRSATYYLRIARISSPETHVRGQARGGRRASLGADHRARPSEASGGQGGRRGLGHGDPPRVPIDSEEEEGFEPPALARYGFQDRRLRPLGHSSERGVSTPLPLSSLSRLPAGRGKLGAGRGGDRAGHRNAALDAAALATAPIDRDAPVDRHRRLVEELRRLVERERAAQHLVHVLDRHELQALAAPAWGCRADPWRSPWG